MTSPWRTFSLIAGAIVVSTLTFSFMFVAFPEIEATFDASATSVSWAVTAFSITVAALMVPAGWLADRFGRKRVFLTGVLIFAVGSAGVALSVNVPMLVAARIVQAAGLSVQSPASLALVIGAFGAGRRSTAVGSYGGLGGIAAAIGPAAGGLLISTIGWRWAFAANVPTALVVVAVGHRLLPDDHGHRTGRPPDAMSIGALVAGVTALALAITQSDDWGWSDPRILASLSIATVLLSTLLYRSARHPEPVLDLSLYRDRNFSVGSLLSFVIGGSFGGMFLTFIVFLTRVWELSLIRAGLTVAMITAIAGPLSFVSGRIADRVGHRRVIIPGSLCLTVAALWLRSELGPDTDILGVWVPAISVYAIGVGLAHAASQAAALTGVPEHKLGIGSAMNRISQELGQVISVALVVTLLAASDGLLAGVDRVMVVLAAVGIVGALAGAALQVRTEARPLVPAEAV